MKYEVGDMVFWEKSPHIKFFIEEVSVQFQSYGKIAGACFSCCDAVA